MQGLSRILCAVFVAVSACARPGHAGPAPCATAADPIVKAAISAAETHWETHWSKGRSGWTTTYTLKPEPKNPLGVLPRPAPMGEPAPDPASPSPIGGLAIVETIVCRYYEINPDGGFVIRLVGRRLSFSDNGAALSRPIASALIEAFVVTQKSDAALSFHIAPLAEAATAIAPDMILSLPPMASEPAPATARRR